MESPEFRIFQLEKMGHFDMSLWYEREKMRYFIAPWKPGGVPGEPIRYSEIRELAEAFLDGYDAASIRRLTGA